MIDTSTLSIIQLVVHLESTSSSYYEWVEKYKNQPKQDFPYPCELCLISLWRNYFIIKY